MKRIASLILVLLLAGPAWGRNVDLSTVPQRKTVQLTIYNAEDLTLVRETRKVSFKKGVNPLQFSWANTLIDSTSVELRFLDHAAQLDVIDTTFPHDKPQMLYWNVQSEFEGEATIEITYFTSGISWSADYILIANADETKLGFEGFVKVTNNSGEDYEEANVRLVVGTINLIEKIADLARRGLPSMTGISSLKMKKAEALKETLELAANAEFEDKDGAADAPMQEKAIAKEGLSEYFIFSIEGTETIPNGWAKRMRSFEGREAPFKIQYRYRPQEYGDGLVRMYLLANDKDSKLGSAPLPDGAVRVFRRNGREGLSFLAQQNIKYIPIGDKVEINLGADPEVIFELIKLRSFRDNIWLQVNGFNVFKQVGGGVEIEPNSSVVGWDDHDVFTQRIRNYTSKAIDVEVRRSYGGDVLFRANFAAERFDFQTVQFGAKIEPGKRIDLLHEVATRQGRNLKHDGVTIEKAEVKP